MSESVEFELLLRRALAPIDPPADLADRVETTLANLAGLAADELESWELRSMRDPRNWVRPAAAVVDRYATRDIALGGATIRAGDLVTVSLAGAGRDPAVFTDANMSVLRSPPQAPKANAYAERWVRTVRTECLDWMLVWSRGHLERVLDDYVRHYNTPPVRTTASTLTCPSHPSI